MKDFTQGLLFGAVVGGLIALLNTPNNGEENRRKVQDYIKDNTNAVNDLGDDLKQLQVSLGRLSEEGMAVADRATKDIAYSVEDFTQKNSPRIRRVMSSINKLTEDLKNEQEKYQDSPLLNQEG
ncbi:YtxH domain-containing protein [Jeotgalibaca caeni]|uniref:YtxH domain-containing protein n=1 Tax=Jeotgalibaca caeni TaxID=3028623 RepID=UPI00237D6393|nr:YtxH domain-containing protein [Jeotgalibaca caeni]MDE1549644.1 YtxH domain-containing protein [Jeotgalibaca caeni]